MDMTKKRGMRNNKDLEGYAKGKAEPTLVFKHTDGELPDDIKELCGFLCDSFDKIALIGPENYALHVWAKDEKTAHIELGNIVAIGKEIHGVTANVLMLMDIDREKKQFITLVYSDHPFYKDTLEAFIPVVLDRMARLYGYQVKASKIWESGEWERRFNGSSHIILDEHGRRLESFYYTVVLDDGSKTFGLVPPALLDFLM